MITGIIDVSRSAPPFSLPNQAEPATLRWYALLIHDLAGKERARAQLDCHYLRSTGNQRDVLVECHVMELCIDPPLVQSSFSPWLIATNLTKFKNVIKPQSCDIRLDAMEPGLARSR